MNDFYTDIHPPFISFFGRKTRLQAIEIKSLGDSI